MFVESMHKSLKYCMFEKKKIRRLDHSIDLVLKLFEDVYGRYMQRLHKPGSNKRTATIFKNHNFAIQNVEEFTIAKQADSESFVVTNLRTNAEYKITLANTASHECYLTCVRCGFCLHTFYCNCNDHQHKGNFCIHLHLLSTAKCELPSFEQPVSKRLTIYNRLKRKETAEAHCSSTLPPVDDNLQPEPDLSSLTSEKEVSLDKCTFQLESQLEDDDNFDDHFNDDLDTTIYLK